MKNLTAIRKTITQSKPVYAALGVTDLAVGAVKSAQADLVVRAGKAQHVAAARAGALRAELTPAKLQADAQNLPNVAISRTLEVAGKAEETLSDLAARGKSLATTVRRRPATKDLLAQGRSTVTLGKAAVTTVRKASDETLVAAKATLTAGRREAANLVSAVVGEVESEVAKAETEIVAEAKAAPAAAKKATRNTRSAAKRTTTTARTRSANVTRATKAVSTSTRKTAAATKKATTSAARTVGTR